MLLVTKDNLESVERELAEAKVISYDTETTGLRYFHGDKPFSVVIATEKEEFYFPVSVGSGVTPLQLIEARVLDGLMGSMPRLVFAHNFKFDLHMSDTIGISFHQDSQLHDTMVVSRLINNTLTSYSLENCAYYFVRENKDDRVKAYVEEHGLWEWVEREDCDSRLKIMHFDQVPFELMFEYACKDARITYNLGMEHRRRILKWDEEIPAKFPRLWKLYERECEFTRVLHRMESRGVKLDRAFTEDALHYAKKDFSEAAREFSQETGEDYKPSSKMFERICTEKGVDTSAFPVTEKGNKKFDKNSLGKVSSPFAHFAKIAKESKTAINFYAGFLWHADDDYRLHTDFKQAGTVTGRLSSGSPNMQNLASPEEASEILGPRQCIIPDSSDHYLFMLDYSQQEYRLMLEYAEEHSVIEQVRNGVDVHQAMADMVGIDRKRAKTLNFAVLYGAGPTRISETLGISEPEAKDLIATFYGKLPGVRQFIDNCRQKAKTRGYILNWTGRVLKFPNRADSYKSPNHLIQGGCADITRLAMIECDKVCTDRTYMSLTIHDELVFNVHKSEIELVPKFQRIMEDVFPHRYLPMKVEISHSAKSLAHKVKGLPL